MSGTGFGPFRMLLLDLDGTFADTAPDLLYALNRLRSERDMASLSRQHFLPWISLGTNVIIREGMQIGETDPEFGSVRDRFLDLYEHHIAEQTQPFPGMPLLLDALQARDMRWGIVTNKLARFTDRLMQALDLHPPPACIVSGDTLERAKPHPDPLLYGCELTGCTAQECLYVGDSASDVLAAHRAGMPALVALFGYIPAHDQPSRWGADGFVNAPLEILEWVDAQAKVTGTC